MFFKYQKKEKATETKFMEIPIVYEVSNLSHGLEKKDSSSPSSGTKQHFEFPPRPLLQVGFLTTCNFLKVLEVTLFFSKTFWTVSFP